MLLRLTSVPTREECYGLNRDLLMFRAMLRAGARFAPVHTGASAGKGSHTGASAPELTASVLKKRSKTHKRLKEVFFNETKQDKTYTFCPVSSY